MVSKNWNLRISSLSRASDREDEDSVAGGRRDGGHASRHIAYRSFGQRWRASSPRGRPRTRDNPCKRPSVYGSRRAKQPALSLSSLANDASHRTPAGYHYCVDNRASFLLSGITTPRPISRPAARPVIAQFFQFTGPSSRVNTENSATERRATGLTDLQGQHPDPTRATSSPSCVFFLVAENPRGVKQIIYRACFMFQHRTAEDVNSL